MAIDITNSPYLQSLPVSQTDALGYSRHYARRMRNMGKANRESWIKKLWSHMFSRKKETQEREKQRAFLEGYKSKKSEEKSPSEQSSTEKTTDRSQTLSRANSNGNSQNKQVQLPPIKSSTSRPSREVNFAPLSRDRPQRATTPKQRDTLHSSPFNNEKAPSYSLSKSRDSAHSKSAPPRAREEGHPKSQHQDKSKPLPAELVNSPYLPKDKGHYKWIMMERQKEIARQNQYHYRERRVYSDPQRKPFDLSAPKTTSRHVDYSYVSNHVDSWRAPRMKGVSMAELEERAKKAVSKAVKVRN